MKFLLACLILVIALAEGADECWKATYNRGTIACSSSEPHDNEGGVCYPKCKDGYYGAGFVCWSRCDASGFSNDCGLYCGNTWYYCISRSLEVAGKGFNEISGGTQCTVKNLNYKSG